MLTPVTIDGQEYLCPSWAEMGQITLDLAKKIQHSGLKFDRVVALAKGGLSWNRQLQDYLRIKNTSSIQVRFYKDINTTVKRPIVIQSLPVSVESESILIFDDVADTGESLTLAKDYLNNHGPKDIKIATLFEKPWSRLKPDFSAVRSKEWVIFPHDAFENMQLLSQKWQLPKAKLSERFAHIGLERSVIDFYLASQVKS